MKLVHVEINSNSFIWDADQCLENSPIQVETSPEEVVLQPTMPENSISEPAIWVILIVFVSLLFSVEYSRNRERLGETIIWLLWDFSGLRFIANKLFLPNKIPAKLSSKRPPNTFIIWVIGIYAAIFGIASNRYENSLDKIESRANSFLMQLTVIEDPEIRKRFLSNIGNIQGLGCPKVPRLLNPFSVLGSLLIEEPDDGTRDLMMGVVKQYSDDLKESNLSNSILTGIQLNDVDISSAELSNADLSNASLYKVNFSGTTLSYAKYASTKLSNSNFNKSYMFSVDFKEAKLTCVNFNSAMLRYSKFDGADLFGCNMQSANLSYTSLNKASLVNINFDGSDLSHATLLNAYLSGSKFKNVNMNETLLIGAILEDVTFIETNNLTPEQLCQAEILEDVLIMDADLESSTKELCPEVFESSLGGGSGGF